MSKAIVSVGSLLIMIVLVSLMAVRGNEGVPGHAAGRAGNGLALPDTYGAGERDALRVKTDTSRGRLWVLGLDDVRVYDAATKKLLRQVALPNWYVAGFICAPDLVVDASGSAYVSSNMLARLWRFDADTLEVRQHDIRLQGREQWDVGFGALAIAENGALYALTSSGGSLWKVDVATATATMIEHDGPPLRGCAFTPRFMKDFERSRKPWTRPLQQRN